MSLESEHGGAEDLRARKLLDWMAVLGYLLVHAALAFGFAFLLAALGSCAGFLSLDEWELSPRTLDSWTIVDWFLRTIY